MADNEIKSSIQDDALNRLAAIGEMSAGIAHEIRNPLTTVKGFLQLLQKEYDHRYWDLIFPELDQAIATVQDLLVVAKPDLDDEPMVQFVLCADIGNILSLFHNELYRIEVKKRFYDTKTQIYGKRNQIKKAVFNLIKNAFEAICEDGTITVEHYRQGEYLYVAIRDTGQGISEDRLKLLGTPFFSTKETGTGMGLTQVYTTFYEYGANIHVESNPGEGTVFIIRMPISSEQRGGFGLNLSYVPGQDVREFFRNNRQEFNHQLELEAKTTFEIVEKSQFVTRQDLLDHANQISDLVHDGLTQEIINLAQERGVAWAQSDVPIISKMEWFYGLRKVIWRFLRSYHLQAGIDNNAIFELADRINDALDNFIVHFNVSFTRYRDDILRSQQAIIEELSVPVIPIFTGVAVLPLIGTLDKNRLRQVEDRLLDEVEAKGIRKIFIDLSAAMIQENAVLLRLTRVIDGIGLLGCSAVLTGIRPQVAKMMLDIDVNIREKIEIESTVQQAIMKESSNALHTI